MSERETWYILEDGSSGDPREVSPDDKGVLRHKNGVAVAIGPYGPRSRGVDVGLHREMKPQQSGPSYLTRQSDSFSKSDDLDSLRAEYQKTFDKKPFHGWDAATLREKIATKAD